MAFSRPYIMDPPEMDKKLGGDLPGAIPPPKLKEIIREFVRLEGHCDKARDICSYNVGQIIAGGDLIPYPDMPVISDPNV